MNNNFTSFVRKSKILALSKLLGSLLLITVLVLIGYATIPLLVFPSIFIFFGIVIYIFANKERKQIIKYKLGVDIDNNIYIPLVFDINYLKKLSNEIDNKKELACNIENLVSYVQYMIDTNQMIFVKKKFELDDVVSLINHLMKEQNINFVLNKNDIIKNDDEIIKLRREDKIINDIYDLAKIRSILEDYKLELLCFFAPNNGFSKLAIINGYILSVVPMSKVETFRKYQVDLSNKLNYNI